MPDSLLNTAAIEAQTVPDLPDTSAAYEDDFDDLDFSSSEKKHRKLYYAGPYLTAFLIPIAVMVIVFIQRGIYPFGDKCFLRTDLYHQYAPFFMELKNKFSGGGSLMYTWNIGGGTAFMPIMAYYLASPMNILLYLCPESLVIEFITGMIVLKLALSSLTLTYYLNYRHEKKGLAAYPAAFFGIFYALSGYSAAYSWNIMWLDCVWLFPLVILGIDRMFKENKGLLYCVTLGFTVYTNYYIAIMVSMGVFIYCFYLLSIEKEMRVHFWTKFAKFMGYTILGVAFSAVFLLPYIRYFDMTASADSAFYWKQNLYSYFSVFDMLARHLVNVDVHTGLDHWPNIYCGVMVFLLVPLYYLNRKITLREKIATTFLILFFLFSFSTRFMDYIWHGFHIPNSLPCRQAFIYLFFLLVMCYRGLLNIEDRTYRDLTITMVAALVFIFAAEKYVGDADEYHFYTFYVSAVFVLGYMILLYAYRRGRFYKDILLIITFTLIAIETCVNTSVTSVTTVTRSDYTDHDEGVDVIMGEIYEEDTTFFRVEKNQNRTKNDGAWLSYHTISTFSSTANKNLTAFYKTLGLEASTNAYGSNGQTPFTNMLLGVKYTISNSSLKEDENIRTLYDHYKNDNDKNVYVYENTYVLPIGYLLNSSDLFSYVGAYTDPIQNQNEYAEMISGVDDLFVDVTPKYETAATVTITIPESGFYYVYSTTSGPKGLKVTHDNFSRTFNDLNRGYIMDLKWCEEGEEVTFANSDTSSVQGPTLTLYKFNADRMAEVYKAFSANVMEVTSFDDTHVNGKVHADETMTLLTTIPAEEGWTVLLDGEEVQVTSWKDAYISITIPSGDHTVSFSYRTPWLTMGLLITLASGAIMILIFVLGMLQKQGKLQLWKRKSSLSEDLLSSGEEAPVSE